MLRVQSPCSIHTNNPPLCDRSESEMSESEDSEHLSEQGAYEDTNYIQEYNYDFYDHENMNDPEEDNHDPYDYDWEKTEDEQENIENMTVEYAYYDEPDAPLWTRFAEEDEAYLLLNLEPERLPEEVRVFGMYKPVSRKIRPIPTVYPEYAQTRRSIPEDPLKDLPELPIKPPEFQPTTRLTQERLDEMGINSDGYLWPEEVKLFKHVIKLNEMAFAWSDEERGSFKDSYFSPYIIPVIPHVPWKDKNRPIPPGHRDEVISILKDKLAAGVYEQSQASYRSRWFCVKKKNGKLRLVHDLQPLNAVTIRDTGVPPILDEFVEPFAGRVIYTVFDMFWGYDARKLAEESRDLTAFQSPLGLLRVTSLPMGATNAVSEFQACMQHVLREEIPDTANAFLDDVPIKGSKTWYLDKEGKPETIPGNEGIRRAVWEHALDVHRICHRIMKAGGTFSGKKTQIGRKEVVIVGQKCTPEGRSPDDSKVAKVQKWPALKTPKDIRGFLGLCGTMRVWIKDYSKIARPLTELIRKEVDFVWGERQQEAFDTLKKLITSAPILRPIDYASERPVILSVDSSKIAVGFILSQLDEQNRKRPARFGSIPMNKTESNYSQPKLELYGLFKALRAYRLYLAGVKNLHVEVDAKYIKGMLTSPDIHCGATMNRWIQGINMFDFKLIHVPAQRHKGPDALSRREVTEEEAEEEQEGDDWLDDIALIIRVMDKSKLEQRIHVLATEQREAQKQEDWLHTIQGYLRTGKVPKHIPKAGHKRLQEQAQQYILRPNGLFKVQEGSQPRKVILDEATRTTLMIGAHEQQGHRGVFAVTEALRSRFVWPYFVESIKCHIASCHECQIRNVRKVDVPLTISAPPATLFTKIHLDVMNMPMANNYHYIIAARDDLTQAAEGRALKTITADKIANFLWEEIICRYGAVAQIVTDNGSEVKGAFELLAARYHIPQIKISTYNARANGVVERGHFIIREALVKTCEGNLRRWPELVPHAFFADKIMTRRATGFSPFYLLFGVDPVMPFDLTEATYMVDGFTKNMSTTDLLSLRIQQLEKRPEDLAKAAAQITRHRLDSKAQFEKRFAHRLRKEPIQAGDLVLLRNNRIEKEMNRKSKPRWMGPYEVYRQTKGGSYVLKEMDGAISRRGVAANRLLHYRPRGEARLGDTFLEEEDSD